MFDRSVVEKSLIQIAFAFFWFDQCNNLPKVGATAAQSIYYIPKSDLVAVAIATRALDAGSMRGFGTLQSMAATEMAIDEIANELGMDAIDLRMKSVFQTGMKNTQGAMRGDEILAKAKASFAVDGACGAQGRVRNPASRPPLWCRLRLRTEGLRHWRRIAVRQGRDRAGRQR